MIFLFFLPFLPLALIFFLLLPLQYVSEHRSSLFDHRVSFDDPLDAVGPSIGTLSSSSFLRRLFRRHHIYHLLHHLHQTPCSFSISKDRTSFPATSQFRIRLRKLFAPILQFRGHVHDALVLSNRVKSIARDEGRWRRSRRSPRFYGG